MVNKEATISGSYFWKSPRGVSLLGSDIISVACAVKENDPTVFVNSYHGQRTRPTGQS